MKRIFTILAAFFVVVLIVVLAVVSSMASKKSPTAIIRVVDPNGKPIVGAVVQPTGMRTKEGPYAGGWYGWRYSGKNPPNESIRTSSDGVADVSYPKFVFERIETGKICFSVSHPDFVAEDVERVVSTSLPEGAPLRLRLENILLRLRGKSSTARPSAVVLQKGAVLRVAALQGNRAATDLMLFAQVSKMQDDPTDCTERPEGGVLVVRKIGAGKHFVRVIGKEADGTLWFSEVFEIKSASGQTNDVSVPLMPGVSIRGEIDDAVPRPVMGGRVVINVWPQGIKAEDGAQRWHAWSPVREDGGFEISSLPKGELEIVAMCDGFISTNGPGNGRMRYPQKHVLGSDGLSIIVGMEETAVLQVWLKDDKGIPVKDAKLMTWPNVRYGDYWSTIVMSDCYNDVDMLTASREKKREIWERNVKDFQAQTDTNGFGTLINLPPTTDELSVEHARYALQPVGTAMGGQTRSVNLQLNSFQTNRLYLRLEPKNQSEIGHY